jgi:hypothetical protein
MTMWSSDGVEFLTEAEKRGRNQGEGRKRRGREEEGTRSGKGDDEESEAREGGNEGKEHGDGKWMRWKSRMDWESEGGAAKPERSMEKKKTVQRSPDASEATGRAKEGGEEEAAEEERKGSRYEERKRDGRESDGKPSRENQVGREV